MVPFLLPSSTDTNTHPESSRFMNTRENSPERFQAGRSLVSSAKLTYTLGTSDKTTPLNSRENCR